MPDLPTRLHLLLDHTGYCWSEILALPGQVVDLDQVPRPGDDCPRGESGGSL